MPRNLNRKLDKLITRRRDAYKDITASLDLTDQQKKIMTNGWIDAIAIMEMLRWKNYLYSMWSLAALVICSAAVAPLINVETDNETAERIIKIVATALSVIVTILTGMRQGFKWTEKWKHYHNSAEALKTEGELFAGLSGVYSNFKNHKAAFPTFLQNANAIKTAQRAEYIRSVADDGGNNDGEKEKGNGKGNENGNGAGGANETATEKGNPAELNQQTNETSTGTAQGTPTNQPASSQSATGAAKSSTEGTSGEQ